MIDKENEIELIDENTKDDKIENSEKENKSNQDDTNEYERICYVCKRTESNSSPIISMPGGLDLCNYCMQKAFDSLGNSNFDMNNMPNIPIMGFNLNDITNFQTNNQSKAKLKKKDKKKDDKEVKLLTKEDILPPHKIKEKLDEYVIGQERAKKTISVGVYNHYKRILWDSKDEDDFKIEKSNILMLGPTGSGKTYLVKTLAKLLNVPLAITDATALTEAGYIGDDIESVLSKLLSEADGDAERAMQGIVFIDEIDKIAKKRNVNTRDVSGESVQQELLKLLEGSSVQVPVGSNQKNALSPLTTINTDNILFICGGAFPDLDKIIRERLKQKTSMGFNSELKDKYEEDDDILKFVTTKDICKFGMIPEFVGRLPIIVTLEKLGVESLIKVLKEPKNAILKQYIKLLELDEVKLDFTEDALEWIAKEAIKKNTGARALRAIIEEFMLDIMYEIPKDNNIGTVTITKEYLQKTGAPEIGLRSL